MITLYGIKNCTTVQKARQWLAQQGIEHHFHDFKREGLTATQVQYWLSYCKWSDLINRRGTTWKMLDAAQKLALETEQGIEVLCAWPTVIKRPVLVTDNQVIIGFTPEHYQNLVNF